MVLPVSATSVLRQLSPRKTIGTSFFTANRFANLREPSPTPSNSSQRSRTNSFKRKERDFGNRDYGASSITEDASSLALLVLVLDTERDVAISLALCSKVAEELNNCTLDTSLTSILGGLCETMRIISNTQSKLVTLSKGLASKDKSNTSNISSKRPRQESGSLHISRPSLGSFNFSSQPSYMDALRRPVREPVLLGNKSSSSGFSGMTTLTKNLAKVGNTELVDEQEQPVDLKAKKFREAVKDAERATLVFNLDMGRVPIMNKSTMSSKATLALTAMAAKAEGKSGTIPSEEAVSAIDDLLSISKGIEFFGNTTKSYKNSKDEKSGSYCTIPVKYVFKDRDTKVRAEAVLRQTCKVRCTTPYPIILRECIRQVISQTKEDFPNDFVRVNVDPVNMCLKVARKPDNESEWFYYKKNIDIPVEALDVQARKVPEGLQIVFPTASPSKHMDTGTGTGRKSSNDSFEDAVSKT